MMQDKNPPRSSHSCDLTAFQKGALTKVKKGLIQIGIVFSVNDLRFCARVHTCRPSAPLQGNHGFDQALFPLASIAVTRRKGEFRNRSSGTRAVVIEAP
jgi:hypothetical protein